MNEKLVADLVAAARLVVTTAEKRERGHDEWYEIAWWEFEQLREALGEVENHV